jgi:hypothetical protein
MALPAPSLFVHMRMPRIKSDSASSPLGAGSPAYAGGGAAADGSKPRASAMRRNELAAMAITQSLCVTLVAKKDDEIVSIDTAAGFWGSAVA